MIELSVYDKSGKEVGSISIDDAVFGNTVRRSLLKDVLVMYESNKRQGTHSTKIRSEIRGANHKPWRQKGTGSARAGSRKSPIWRGGGIIFGPKPRDYSSVIPKKMRSSALRSAILSKIRDKQIKVIDDLSFDLPKTRDAVQILTDLGIQRSCLIGLNEPVGAEAKSANDNVYKSFRNIRNGKVIVRSVLDFNAYDVIKHKDLLLTRSGLESMVERFSAEKKTTQENN